MPLMATAGMVIGKYLSREYLDKLIKNKERAGRFQKW